MYWSTTFEAPSYAKSHTWSRICVRLTTSPAWRMSSSSRAISFGDSDSLDAATPRAVRCRIEPAGHRPRAARGRGAGSTANKRTDTRRELGEAERLGQVVVGADIEAVDPVVDAVPSGEQQHRRPTARRPSRRQTSIPSSSGSMTSSTIAS